MSQNRTLIAYETKQGASKEAATKIGQVLQEKYGLDVTLVDLKDEENPSIDLYRNVIVGAGARGGRIYGKALKFLKADFTGKKVAFFVCSSWGGTPGSYENAKGRFVKKTLKMYPKLNLAGAEAFGGRIRYFGKTMLDNTDLNKVGCWAEELGKNFLQ
jgi:menaquinone-dependent protoporphyrinogen IX oxidase